MAKFIFKLQNVLNVKLNLEKQAKAEFAVAVQRLMSEEEKLERIYADMKAYQERIRNASETTLNIIELIKYTEAVEVKKEQAEVQKKNIKIAEHAYEMARQKLGNIMTDRKTYEVLQDKAFEDFKREIEATERKETDELVSYRFGSNADTDVNDGANQVNI